MEEQITQWRAYLRGRQAIHTVDVEELESHLRDQVESLSAVGLSEDEAFLVAVKRMGALDELSREFAREHSDRLWKQLVVVGPPEEKTRALMIRELRVVLGLAVLAAVLFKTPAFFGLSMDDPRTAELYVRVGSLFVLPLLAGYFAWKRGVERSKWLGVAAFFGLAAVVMNVYPFVLATADGTEITSDTLLLATLHLAIASWLVVGVTYAAGRWRDGERRMDYIRFSGEFFIYYVLIALGGGVFTMFTFGIFQAIGLDIETLVGEWIVPCGALGAVLVASWLVEAKQSVIENIAPVLTRVFIPFFTVTLVVFLATMAVTGRGIDVERDVLIGFDLGLALVFALLLYFVSARAADAPPNILDTLVVVLVVSALIVDVLALVAIGRRISDLGFTPNRVAALGENIVLLVNLSWSAWLYGRFVARRGSFGSVTHWQTAYLPVFAVWAAFVVVVFPPLFGFR